MTRSKQRLAFWIERCDGSLRQTSVAATAQPSSRNQNAGLGKPVSASASIVSVSGFCSMGSVPAGTATGRLYRNHDHPATGGTPLPECRLLAHNGHLLVSAFSGNAYIP